VRIAFILFQKTSKKYLNELRRWVEVAFEICLNFLAEAIIRHSQPQALRHVLLNAPTVERYPPSGLPSLRVS
jgi:hypothetical protein